MRKDSLRRFKERDVRQRFVIILGGKMLGIASLLGRDEGLRVLLRDSSRAQHRCRTPPQRPTVVSAVNTVWVLVTAFLVFFMQAGFMALEAGFARSREPVNVLMSCVFDTCVCGILYWAIGFAFQFGAGNGFIGHQYFFLHGTTADLRLDRGGVPRVLPVPVRVRRHGVDGHHRRDGRSHRLQGRHPLQHRRVRASSTRSSVTGSGVRAAGSATRWAGSAAS